MFKELQILERAFAVAADRSQTFCRRTRKIISIFFKQSFDFFFLIVRKLVPVTTEELDAVVLNRIVRSRDHDSCISILQTNEIGNARSRHDTQSEHFDSD